MTPPAVIILPWQIQETPTGLVLLTHKGTIRSWLRGPAAIPTLSRLAQILNKSTIQQSTHQTPTPNPHAS